MDAPQDSQPAEPVSASARRPRRPALMLGLIVMLLIGVGAAIRISTTLRDREREAAQRAQSAKHLQQVGLAVLSHLNMNSQRQYPPAAIEDSDGLPILSWRVAVAPYLEGAAALDSFKLDESWDGPTNLPLAEHAPPNYLSPGDPSLDLGRTNVVAVVSPEALISSDGAVNQDDCPDGTSRTLLAVELAGFGPQWSEPADITVDEFVAAVAREPAAAGPLRPLYHGGVLCLFADGSVRMIASDTDPAVLRALATRAGGETIPPGIVD